MKYASRIAWRTYVSASLFLGTNFVLKPLVPCIDRLNHTEDICSFQFFMGTDFVFGTSCYLLELPVTCVNRLDQNMQDIVGLKLWSLWEFTCLVILIIQEELFLIP